MTLIIHSSLFLGHKGTLYHFEYDHITIPTSPVSYYAIANK